MSHDGSKAHGSKNSFPIYNHFYLPMRKSSSMCSSKQLIFWFTFLFTPFCVDFSFDWILILCCFHSALEKNRARDKSFIMFMKIWRNCNWLYKEHLIGEYGSRLVSPVMLKKTSIIRGDPKNCKLQYDISIDTSKIKVAWCRRANIIWVLFAPSSVTRNTDSGYPTRDVASGSTFVIAEHSYQGWRHGIQPTKLHKGKQGSPKQRV